MNAYWLVVAGGFVAVSLMTAGALVISPAGLLFITSFVDGLDGLLLLAMVLVLAMLALPELAGGSLDAELVEFD